MLFVVLSVKTNFPLGTKKQKKQKNKSNQASEATSSVPVFFSTFYFTRFATKAPPYNIFDATQQKTMKFVGRDGKGWQELQSGGHQWGAQIEVKSPGVRKNKPFLFALTMKVTKFASASVK